MICCSRWKRLNGETMFGRYLSEKHRFTIVKPKVAVQLLNCPLNECSDAYVSLRSAEEEAETEARAS